MRRQRNNAESWHRSDGGVWLPGAADAADVPRVAGDPMRGAGIVRRGMGFGFEPAGCCCVTGGCGEYGPMLYDPSSQTAIITIAGMPTSPCDCSPFNGVWEVAFLYISSRTNDCLAVFQQRPFPSWSANSMLSCSFTIDTYTGYRRIDVGFWDYLPCIPGNNRYLYGGAVLQELGVTTRWDNAIENIWNVPAVASSGCEDVSGATVTVEIGSA